VLSDAPITAQAQQTATGGSAMKAVEVIMEHGVPEDRIIFINLVGVVFYLYSIF
jgi:uracil phosphoribosyltransferase